MKAAVGSGHLAGEGHEQQAPGGDRRLAQALHPVPVEGGPGLPQALADPLVQGQAGVKHGEEPELPEPLDAADGEPGLPQEQGQLVPQA